MVPPEDGKCLIYSLVLDRGSLGPSTVTLMALVYVATWGGVVDTVMVMLKLFPENTSGDTSLLNRKIRIEVEGRRYFRVSSPSSPISPPPNRGRSSIYHRSSFRGKFRGFEANEFCATQAVDCGRPTESSANRDLNSLRSRPPAITFTSVRFRAETASVLSERASARAEEKRERGEEDVRRVEHRCAYITDQGLEVEGSVY